MRGCQVPHSPQKRIKRKDRIVCLFYAKVFLEDDTIGEVAITERIMEEYLPKVKDAEELYRLVTEQVQPEELRFESSLSVMERFFLLLYTSSFCSMAQRAEI